MKRISKVEKRERENSITHARIFDSDENNVLLFFSIQLTFNLKERGRACVTVVTMDDLEYLLLLVYTSNIA